MEGKKESREGVWEKKVSFFRKVVPRKNVNGVHLKRKKRSPIEGNFLGSSCVVECVSTREGSISGKKRTTRAVVRKKNRPFETKVWGERGRHGDEEGEEQCGGNGRE